MHSLSLNLCDAPLKQCFFSNAVIVLKIFRKRVPGKVETMNVQEVVCVHVLKHTNDALSHVSTHVF